MSTNARCPCGSGKKAKKCCLRHVDRKPEPKKPVRKYNPARMAAFVPYFTLGSAWPFKDPDFYAKEKRGG